MQSLHPWLSKIAMTVDSALGNNVRKKAMNRRNIIWIFISFRHQKR